MINISLEQIFLLLVSKRAANDVWHFYWKFGTACKRQTLSRNPSEQHWKRNLFCNLMVWLISYESTPQFHHHVHCTKKHILVYIWYFLIFSIFRLLMQPFAYIFVHKNKKLSSSANNANNELCTYVDKYTETLCDSDSIREIFTERMRCDLIKDAAKVNWKTMLPDQRRCNCNYSFWTWNIAGTLICLMTRWL